MHCSDETCTLHPAEYVAFAFTLLTDVQSAVEQTNLTPLPQLVSALLLLDPVKPEMAAVLVAESFVSALELDSFEARSDDLELPEPALEFSSLEPALV